MKLSIYTAVRNGLRFDYHLVAMLKHHLPLADEIIVNEGFSSDGTLSAISKLDSKIRIFRTHWGDPVDVSWFARFKDEARRRATGDWAILLDCDEFIPEWDFGPLREYLTTTPEVLVPVRVLNFYGSYQVYHRAPERVNWPARKMIIHRNLPDLEVWGDGSNVRRKETEAPSWTAPRWFDVHHFGFVRHAARLREKWRNVQAEAHGQRKRGLLERLPSFVFNLRPHDWFDPQFLPHLATYEGPHIRPVREDPQEFVRDSGRLYKHLRAGPAAWTSQP